MPRPSNTDFPLAVADYIALVPGQEIRSAFFAQRAVITSLLEKIPEDKADHAYAPGKWTLKELFQHIIDAERIFSYRALCIARGEKENLPAFDENEYARQSEAWDRNWNLLKDEFDHLRRSTEMMFNSFNEQQLMRTGTAGHKMISVNAIGFTLIGHMYHHINIIRSRYL